MSDIMKVCFIFNKYTRKVVRAYLSEEECISKYNEEFDGYEEYDWRVVNLDYVLDMIF